MLACISSAVVSHLLSAGSLYTEALRKKGIYLPSASTPTWIREPEVRGYLNPDVATVAPAERFGPVMDTFLRAPEGQDHLYVTTSEGRCLGVISLHDIKRFFRDMENLESVIAADLVNPTFPFVYADEPISRAIELLSEQSYERLPVLDSPSARRLLGTVSKRKLLYAYSESSLARQQSSPSGATGGGTQDGAHDGASG
jgi:CBS domain-containing protein